MNKRFFNLSLSLQFFFFFSILALSAFWLLPSVSTADEQPTPDEILASAWEKATDSGRYAFDSQIEQTAYPVASLTNAGRPPENSQIAMSGQIDLPNEIVETTLWRGTQGLPEQRMTIRTEDGQTRQRFGAGAWEPVGQNTDLFTPNNDPLTFLQVATDIKDEGVDSREVGDSTLTYQLYSFEIDAEAYSNLMRRRFEEQLAQYGTLPGGMTLQTPEIYRNMSGSGQIWLDGDGLPVRLSVQLDLPPYEETGRILADFTSDFHSYDRSRIAQAAVPFWESPQSWFTVRETAVLATLQQVGFAAAALLVAVAFGLFIAVSWQTQTFQKVFPMVMVFAMLAGPMLQARQASAFHFNFYASANDQQAEREENEQMTAAQYHLTQPNFDPNQPVADQMVEKIELRDRAADSAALLQPRAASGLTQNASGTNSDTDGDGLSDADEDDWDTCAYAGAPINCDNVVDPADSDGDGIKDGIEVYNLTTDPYLFDTDGDLITDTLEVNGFFYNGKTWYLNPNELDSNKDGLPDGQECLVWTPLEFDTNAICPDTDSDGTPDVWDDDNDGDGVLDNADLSPFVASSELHTVDDPMTFEIDGLQTGKAVFVDVQLRPSNVDHLDYIGTVLDWPTGDTQGQIQRRLDTTFATTANADLQASDALANNGDVRLVPIVQIKIPYESGHYGNLPVLPGYKALSRTADLTVDQWLDTSKLDPYGISVQDVDDGSGDLIVTMPLTAVTDPDGGARVAYNFRMLYWPEQQTWGNEHEITISWVVQMITDECIDPNGDPDTCARQDTLQIIHAYPETWSVTGMKIREDHDFDVAIVYEDPAQDSDTSSDDDLWLLSWNMNNEFLSGRDCDSYTNGVCQGDGQRDVTVANLESSIDGWSSGNDALAVTKLDYDHQDYVAHVMMTETTKVLDTAFTGANLDTATLLFATEEVYRSSNLSYATQTGSDFDFDLTDYPAFTDTRLSWTPYRQINGVWENEEMGQYLDQLQEKLKEQAYFQPTSNDAESEAIAEGKLIWAQLYFTAFNQGFSDQVMADSTVLWGSNDPDKVPDDSYDLAWPPTTFTGASTVTIAYLKVIYEMSAKFDELGFWSNVSKSFGKQYPVNSINNPTDPFNKTNNGVFRHPTATMAIFAALSIIIVVGLALFAFGFLTGNNLLQRIGEIILNVATIVMTLVAIQNYMVAFIAAQNLSTFSAQLSFSFTNTAYIGVGLIVQALLIWGGFLYSAGSAGLLNNPNSIAFGTLLAFAIAQTLVIVILTAISLIPIVGNLIVLTLILIDAVLAIIGIRGLQERLIEAIAESLYDVDFVIRNLDSGTRLDFSFSQMAFTNDAAGFTTAQSISYTMSITNGLRYKAEHGATEAKKSAFVYALQQNPDDDNPNLDLSDLQLNKMRDEWDTIGHRTIEMNATAEMIDGPVALSGVGAGINQNLSDHIYLTEAFLVPYVGCWQFAGAINTDCTTYSYGDNIHLDVGQYSVLDILPSTLSGFYQFNWATDGPTRFPKQLDQDGDGLLIGTDPFPLKFDGDGDGLSDYFEVANGYDATKADSDGDGLTDGEELRRGLNARVADADDDGLTDKAEWEGWQVVYDYEPDGTPLLTWAWPDPFSGDLDFDRLSDQEESFYALHPRIPSSEDAILNTIQFSEGDVTEVNAPQRLFRFDEEANATSFLDNASRELALCEGDSCPTAESDGRYNHGVTFDGTNDYLATDFVLNPGSSDMTVALWFNANDLSGTGAMVQQKDGSGTGRSWLNTNPGGTISTYIGGNQIASTTAVGVNEWHHAAVTSDGSTVTLYLDGQVERTVNTTAEASNGDLLFGIWKDTASNPFAGSLDEIVITDTALDLAEINALMDGKYNVSDLIVSPGDSIDVQLTISNTNPVYPAKVVYYGEPENLTNVEEITYTHRVRFDESAGATSFNIEGAASNGSCNNGAGECPTAGQTGPVGSAIYLEADDELNLDPILANYTGDGSYTFSFWFNPDADMPSSFQNVLLKILDNNGGVNQDDSRISINYSSRQDVMFSAGGDGSAPPGEWHNFALAHNANSDTISVYFDGVLDGEFIRTDWNIQAGDRFRIGGPLAPDYSFDHEYEGLVDDIIFFDQHLTEDQLQAVLAGNNPEAPVLPTVDNYTVGTQNSIDISALFTIPANQPSGPYIYSQLAEAALDIPDQRSVQLEPGMMVHFDEPQGSSGNQNLFIYPEEDAYCDGGCPTLVEDFAGLAAEFDGVTGQGYGFGPNNNAWNDGAWSMSTWIYPTHGDNVARGIMGSETHETPGLFMTADDKLGFTFHDGTGWNTDFTPGGTIVRNRWNQVGMTYDGSGNFQAYLNGEPLGGDSGITGESASLLSYMFVGKIGSGYQPFQGRIDNVVLYDQLLSDGQMKTLQGSEDLSLHLHYTLDEPPGSNNFIDSAGLIGDGSCTNCPSLGIRGAVNRAAYFDGDQINSLANLPEHWRNNFHGAEWTVSYWLKAEYGRVVETKGTANPFQIYTNRWNYGRTNDTGGFVSSTNVPWATPPATEWTHIMLSFDNDDYSQGGIFINGVKIGSGGTIIDWDPFGPNPFRIGGSLKGYVDDVRFYNRAFSTESAVQLYEQTRPQLQLEFEETGNAVSFADQSPNDYSGTVVNAIPGLAGRIGNGVNFIGNSSVNLGSAPNINTITETLTIMTWVHPEQSNTDPQLIVGSGLDNSANGFGFGIEGSGLWFSDGTTTVQSGDIGLIPNTWQQVGVKVGTDGTVTFFLDGEPVGYQGGVTLIANTDDDLYLGGRPQADGSMGDYLFGQVDELFIYNRGLPNAEIGAAYDNQFRWFRQQIDTTLIVDNDVPTITLQTTQTHWPNSYIQLAVGTVDQTSSVWSFEMGLQGPNDGSMTWQAAPACDDGAFGAVWCPGFDPSTLDGEGAYQLQFRAIDAVGNETTSGTHTIYVDATGPTPTGSHDAFSNGLLIPISGRENAWRVEIFGGVTDPGGAGASGVDKSTVVVQLFNEAGLPVGEPQATPDNFLGAGWQMYYEIFGRPHGLLVMQVTATDNVGNTSTYSFDIDAGAVADGVFEVDSRPAAVELDSWLYPSDGVSGSGSVSASGVISQPVTVSGFASESPAWGGALARYNFEEPDGTTIYDLSGNGNDATCTNCPTHVTGQIGQALQFDGVDDGLKTPFLINPLTTTFSIALWFNADGSTANASSNSRPLITQQNVGGIGRPLLYLDNNNRVRSNLGYDNNGTFAGPKTITHDSWHHAVLTFDGTDARIYFDGELGITYPVTAETSIGELLIGQDKSGTEFFTGLIDDVQILDRVLGEMEVAALATTNTSGVNRVDFWLEAFNFFGDAPTADWQNATLGSSGSHFTSWQRSLPSGLNGFYQFKLRSVDEGFNLSGESILWRGIIDMIDPTVSVSAELIGAGSAAYTEVNITATDDFLDLNNSDLVCGEETWQKTTYQADQARTGEVNATCRLAGHITTPIDVSACDFGGRCATDSVTLTPSANSEGVTILTPQNNGVITSTTSPLTTTVSGVAYDPDGISKIELYIDGALHDQISPAGSPTDFAWSLADWQPISSGQYTLQADMTDTGNNKTSDTINVEISFISCYAEYTGDGVTDFSSGDASAVRNAIDQAPAGTIVRVAGFCGNFSDLDSMLTISKTVTIEGGYKVNGDWSTSDPDTHETILSGQENGQVIYISTGADVILRNLTVANGELPNGGGIYQENGTSTLENLIIRDNTGFSAGGGLLINGGTMVITGSEIVSNTTVVNGGGLMVQGSSTVLTITNSLIAHNKSSFGHGGGLYNSSATITIDRSTFEDNQANTDSKAGGAIYHTSASNLIVLKNSTIYNNRAEDGGGLMLINNWKIENSTISGNSAGRGSGIRSTGAGSIIYSTIVDNINSSALDLANSPNVMGTIIASNDGWQCRGTSTMTDGGYNIISDERCTITAGTSISNTDPLLMPLGDYGGPTLTHKPMVGSPAVDAIPNGVAGCGTTITSDQTGVARPKDAGCDIGAVEGDINYAPAGVSDIYTPIEDIPFTQAAAGVLANDSDANGDSITAILETDVVTGTLNLASNGSFTYSAPADYCGPDSFTYRASDGSLSSDPITVRIDVLCTNDAPTATADSFTVGEDAQNSLLDLLGNDSDIDGHDLIITEIGTTSAGGTTVISGTQVAYSPAENYAGIDTFSYVIRDTNYLTATAMVTVTITAVNDDPTAVDDTFTVAEDSENNLLDVLDNDSDIESNAFSITQIGPLSDGGTAVAINSGSQISYTPTLNFRGIETFSYTVTDEFGGESMATVTVTVTSGNDEPVATDDTFTVAEDAQGSLLDVLDNDNDLDGDTLSVSQIGQLDQGGTASVSINGSQISYTPTLNFFGTEVFSYTVSDGFSGEATATVTVTVTAVNDDPTAVSDSAVTFYDEPVGIAVLDNDSDIDGDDLTISSVTQGDFGSVGIDGDAVIYTPTIGYVGPDGFGYVASDGNGGFTFSSVEVEIREPINGLPKADAGGPYAVLEGGSVVLNGSNSSDHDQETATLAFAWDLDNDGQFDDASGITTTFSAENLTGPISVTVALSVTDAKGATNSAVTTVTVLEPIVNNTDPTAEAGGPYTVTEGESITLDGSGSADAEQDPATLTYLWDFDGDGFYDDASGITPTFSALSLQAPLSVTVRLQVIDVGGLMSTDSALINVVAAEYELAVALSGNGSGVVTSDPTGISCAANCSATYLSHTIVTLTATPSAGSTFAGWGGACEAETSPTCTITMTQVRSVTATFTDQTDQPGPVFSPSPLNSPANGSEVTSPKVSFNWDDAFSDEGDTPIAKYTLIVTGTQSAGRVANETYTFETTETSLTPDFEFPAGKYEWTVTAEDTAGNKTPAEQVFTFTQSEGDNEPIRIYLPLVVR